MSRIVRLAIVVGLAVWAWRLWAGRGGQHERAAASYADGSSIVLEPGSPGFERLAAAARSAVR